jgi:branched-chain amino acid transport system substrate-binding protein
MRNPIRSWWLSVAAAVSLAVLACGTQQSTTSTSATDPGIFKDKIILGATYPLSGSASFYYAVAKGATAYFNYVNDKEGGVYGRKIQYDVIDDGYDPAKAPAATRELIQEHKIFAAFGTLGTPTNTVSRPIYNEAGVPQLLVYTGASKWGSEYKQYPWTIGYQPDYISESKVYAKDILSNHPNAKMGILYQNDAYGKDYLEGMKQGLGSKYSSVVVDEETYESTAVDVSSQVAAIKNKGADTLFIVCIPGQAISAMTAAYKLNWKPTIYLNNVAASQTYMQAVVKNTGTGASVNGIISTAYVKDPNDTAKWGNDAGVKLYKDAMAKYCSGCDPVDTAHFTGFNNAYAMIWLLKKAGKDSLSRKSVMDAARNMNITDSPFLLPGMTAHTSGDQQFPITQLQIETYGSDKWTLQGQLIDARK